MRKKVRIPKARLEKINKYLTVEPKNEEECLPEDTTITEELRRKLMDIFREMNALKILG